jgi:hypothetical protein
MASVRHIGHRSRRVKFASWPLATFGLPGLSRRSGTPGGPIGSFHLGIAAPQITAAPASPPEVTLSAAAPRVSRIATRNGDQDFLMIDKTAGEIIAFEHGKATFSGAVLAGESLSDSIPPEAWASRFPRPGA